MREFNNILYIGRGLDSEKSSVSQAIMLACNNKAKLKVAVLYPVLPKKFDYFKESFQHALLTMIQNMVESVFYTLGYTQQQINSMLTIEIASTNARKSWVINQVLRNDYDLVVKQAEVDDKNTSLKAIDMGLIRKCPCPVWVYHDPNNSYDIKHVVVAIDPDSEDAAGNNFAVNLLKFADYISNLMQSKLSVIACWDIPGFQGIPEAQVLEIKQEEEDRHSLILDISVKTASLNCKYSLNQIKGNPSKMIPEFIEKNSVDLLVMGTVARTGISGLLIGNTAENILQRVGCSIVVLKPRWMV